MTPINIDQKSGFALLLTLLIITVVISVTLAIVELSLKQLELSVNSRDSEIAFAAANAGLECAERTRRSASSTIENGTATTFDCFEQSSNVNKESSLGITVSGSPANGNVYRYKNPITWGDADRCSEIDIVAMVSNDGASGPLVIGGTGANSLKKVFPGYYDDTKTCKPGGNCTIASVRGYSTNCANKTKSGTLMREILLEF